MACAWNGFCFPSVGGGLWQGLAAWLALRKLWIHYGEVVKVFIFLSLSYVPGTVLISTIHGPVTKARSCPQGTDWPAIQTVCRGQKTPSWSLWLSLRAGSGSQLGRSGVSMLAGTLRSVGSGTEPN